MIELDHNKTFESYKVLDTNETLRWALISSTFLVILGFLITTQWLLFNETRLGYFLYDPIIASIPAVNLTSEIFFTTYAAIFIGLLFSLRTPWMMVKTNVSILALLVLRMISMYLLPLEPPVGIIPLEDAFLTSTVYDHQVLMKDLFFSGHTASIAVLIFLVEKRVLSILLFITSLAVGTMLIIQHVHYTIDVLAAFGFAWMAAKMGRNLTEQLLIFIRLAISTK